MSNSKINDKNEKIKKCKSLILGAFVKCYRRNKDDWRQSYILLDDWIKSCVLLTEIKTIHDIEIEDVNKCIFYTYEDTWFMCHMTMLELVQEINDFKLLSKINTIPEYKW